MNDRRWLHENLTKLFSQTIAEQEPATVKDQAVKDQTVKDHTKIRISDLFFSPGIVTGRVYESNVGNSSNSFRVQLSVETFDDQSWNVITQTVAKSALFLGSLINDKLPEKFVTTLAALDLTLIPSECTTKCESKRFTSTYISLFLSKLLERFEAEPTLLLVLRGKPSSELIQQALQVREELSLNNPTSENSAFEQLVNSTPIVITEERFWKANEEIFTFAYDIKADELPASLLRRLGPLRGDSEEIESLFEEAYGDIARQAQAYGLSFR
jgi:uncharacterized Zn finger protein